MSEQEKLMGKGSDGVWRVAEATAVPHIHEVTRGGVLEGEKPCTRSDCKLTESAPEPQTASETENRSMSESRTCQVCGGSGRISIVPNALCREIHPEWVAPNGACGQCRQFGWNAERDKLAERIATLERALRSTLEFLENLEASDDLVVQPESRQAAGFWMLLAEVRAALVETAQSATNVVDLRAAKCAADLTAMVEESLSALPEDEQDRRVRAFEAMVRGIARAALGEAPDAE